MEYQRYRTVLLHLLGLSFFVGYEIVLLFIFGTPPTFRGYLAFGLDIATFYINLLWVIPYLFTPGRQLLFITRLCILVVIHLALRNLITYWNGRQVFDWTEFIVSKRIIVVLWRLLYIIGLGFLFQLIKERQRRERERQQLQLRMMTTAAEAARVESTLFQMQLSPHLLFNTLTFIQAKAQEIHPAVEQAINLLADISRHSLIDIRSIKTVSLADEIQEIRNRIRLQGLLNESELCLVFNTVIEEGADQLQLPPSLLLTLTDNVIKYGVLNDLEFPARLEVFANKNSLRYYSWNLKTLNARRGAGLGINGVKSILEYYYPGRYTMDIIDREDCYSLELKIEL
ncbi:histidine kinase [Niabella sp. CC-SYL272]|uniref:histidine kinase n=1 Tax=Niabella agricola TaxID=2891571 RepID=UPI001F1A3838|nr:histidine kinase [Niabella agricola]MCF3109615.1 histidine kinase [Niabella agricola]